MPHIQLRPHPPRYDRMRYGATVQGDLRVYGQVTTMQGKKKRISFRVRVSKRMMRYRRNLHNRFALGQARGMARWLQVRIKPIIDAAFLE